MSDLHCAGCGNGPKETHGIFCSPGQSADQYVRYEEGTLDAATGAYLCDNCYIRYGMPTGDGRRWTATPANLRDLRIEDYGRR